MDFVLFYLVYLMSLSHERFQALARKFAGIVSNLATVTPVEYSYPFCCKHNDISVLLLF